MSTLAPRTQLDDLTGLSWLEFGFMQKGEKMMWESIGDIIIIQRADGE